VLVEETFLFLTSLGFRGTPLANRAPRPDGPTGLFVPLLPPLTALPVSDGPELAGFPPTSGADLSLVTVFLSCLPPWISDKSFDRSLLAFGGPADLPPPPRFSGGGGGPGGGGGGGGGIYF
jgi:hypothetical protein